MAYTDGTLADERDAINLAIQSILTGGQSYSLGGRTFTRASLAELFKMKKDVAAKIRRAGGASSSTLADFNEASRPLREDQL